MVCDDRDTQSRRKISAITKDGHYTEKETAAAYIRLFGHLPDNYISKRKARNLGWDNREGNLQDVAPGMSIGGSRYRDLEGALPRARGRIWTECDIDYHGGYRGPKRLVFSNDGLIYFTEKHYQIFEQLT